MIESMLTTVDNPHDPFTDFKTWFSFDVARGYHTSGLLARVVITSSDLSEADANVAIDNAIDEIVKENVNGLYRKVSREVPSASTGTGTTL